MAFVLGFLLVLLIATATYSLSKNFSIPAFISQLAGFTGLAFAFVKALSSSNLRVYLWFQRLRIWWLSDSVTRWWFAAGLDGDFTTTVMRDLIDFLGDRKRFKFATRIDYSKEREIQVEIDRTLTLKIALDPAALSASGRDHISILSKVLEVSYGHARRKIDTQIVPVILALSEFFCPESAYYDLNVDFPEHNPFFSIYIANLRKDQIGDFKVVLHLDAYSRSPRPETVEISRQNLHVTAQSTDSFRQLALDFILLSADTKLFSGAKASA